MQLFYHPNIEGSELALDKEESRHLIQVLRKRAGDGVFFTDGKGFRYEMSILDPHPKKAILQVKSKTAVHNSASNLNMGIAPTKNIDRLEWFLEKATEIGISTIFPFISEHSERKIIKEERLNKIIIGAMKQSLRFTKPELKPLQTIDQLLSSDFEGDKFLCHQFSDFQLSERIQKNNKTLILIGPEGDFSEGEMNLALSNNFTKVVISDHRLRTETAGIVACQTFNQFRK